MAVELKKFQAELKTIEGAVTAAYGEWKMVGDSQGNFNKLPATTTRPTARTRASCRATRITMPFSSSSAR